MPYVRRVSDECCSAVDRRQVEGRVVSMADGGVTGPEGRECGPSKKSGHWINVYSNHHMIGGTTHHACRKASAPTARVDNSKGPLREYPVKHRLNQYRRCIEGSNRAALGRQADTTQSLAQWVSTCRDCLSDCYYLDVWQREL